MYTYRMSESTLYSLPTSVLCDTRQPTYRASCLRRGKFMRGIHGSRGQAAGRSCQEKNSKT